MFLVMKNILENKAKTFIELTLGEVLIDDRYIKIPHGTKNSIILTKKQFYQLLGDFVHQETEDLREKLRNAINVLKT